MNWIPEDPTFLMDDVPCKLRPFIYVLLHGPRKLGVEHLPRAVRATAGESQPLTRTETRQGRIGLSDSSIANNG